MTETPAEPIPTPGESRMGKACVYRDLAEALG